MSMLSSGDDGILLFRLLSVCGLLEQLDANAIEAALLSP